VRKLRKLLRLDPVEIGTLAQAVILLPLTALALRLAGEAWSLSGQLFAAISCAVVDAAPAGYPERFAVRDEKGERAV
jgi:hypothetical protein